jgi:hypothetical protein
MSRSKEPDLMGSLGGQGLRAPLDAQQHTAFHDKDTGMDDRPETADRIRAGAENQASRTSCLWDEYELINVHPETIFLMTQDDGLVGVNLRDDIRRRRRLVRAQVSSVRIQSSASWLDRLLALTAGVAHAKGKDGTTKQGVISPDGKYFFVVGSTETVTKQARGSNFDITVAPIGLEVVAVSDGTLQQKITSEAYNAQFSPNGRHLFLTGWNENSNEPWTDIYDMPSASITKHLVGVPLIPVRHLDGTPTVQSAVMISDNLCDMASVNPDTWALVSSWRAPVCNEWLAAP